MKTLEELHENIPIVDLHTKSFWMSIQAAQAKYGQRDERLIRAINYVIEGRVKIHDDGKSATVEGHGEFPYTVHANGTCNCADAQTRVGSWRCKHSLATGLIRKMRIIYETLKLQEMQERENDELYAVMG